MKSVLILALFAFLPFCVQASEPSPYVGQEARSIKSLSADEQADLIAGRGMGFALTAELNGYPGPAHVLELDSKLQLTEEQRKNTEALFNDMESKAKSLGARLIDAELLLDTLFATRQVTQENLTSVLDEIGSLQARLRAVHLRAHLEQSNILSGHQIIMYNKLRGYSGERTNSGHDRQHSH